MVDVVKVRRKAKEKLARAQEGEPGEAAPAVASEEGAAHAVTNPAGPPASAADDGRPGESGGGERIPRDSAAPSWTTADAAARLEAFKERVGRGGDAEVEMDAAGPKEVELELLTFLVGDEVYAIDIEQIVEIVTPRTATRVPNAGPGVLGIISLRGTIVTVVDVRGRLSHPGLPLTPTSRMVVVSRHGETAAFTVDRVLRVVSFSPHALDFAPSVEGSEYHDYIMGVFRQESSLTILLDIDKVLSA